MTVRHNCARIIRLKVVGGNLDHDERHDGQTAGERDQEQDDSYDDTFPTKHLPIGQHLFSLRFPNVGARRLLVLRARSLLTVLQQAVESLKQLQPPRTHPDRALRRVQVRTLE